MLAPNALDAICCPIAPSAAVISLVVVVFPVRPGDQDDLPPAREQREQIGV